MDGIDFAIYAQQCAPTVHIRTLAALTITESTFNPYAIGVVGSRLIRQPKNKAEAIATANALIAGGWNFSVGTLQVNRYNWAKYGLNVSSAFEICPNMRAGAAILVDCFDRALLHEKGNSQKAILSAFSCYNSGNFVTGYKTGYVQTVVQNNSNVQKWLSNFRK